MKIEWDKIKNLPHPTLPDTRRDVLMGSIKLEGGIDLDTLEIVFNPFGRKVQVTWNMIPDTQSAQARYQHMVQNGASVFAYSCISAVQARLDDEFNGPDSLIRRQEFDLPAGTFVESGMVDPETF